jgi:hypothetical protein
LKGKTKKAKLLRLDRMGLLVEAIDGPGFTSRERSLAVVIMQDALPKIKPFLKGAGLSEMATRHVTGFLVAFVMHLGRMSAAQVACAIRIAPRHRAQVMRFLAQNRWSGNWWLLSQLAELVLIHETRQSGRWLLLLDQTYCTQQGGQTENTFSHGKKGKSGKERRRRQKSPCRRCHCFMMGLLLTPSGFRIPLCRSYDTQDYLAAKNQKRSKQNAIPYRRQTELAAELVRTAPVPAGAKMVLLGDTAFDAESIHKVCRERGCSWIVPLNQEGVLAAAKPRPKVWSLVWGFRARQFAALRLTPGKGRFVAQRRVAACRIGPKVKSRTFYVHQERRELPSIGDVQLVFSTTIEPKPGKPLVVQKILMTNDPSLSAAMLVELYDLRWQSELFFKELKSTLGFHQYRFQRFEKVAQRVELCLVAFVYLEWHRAEKLASRALSQRRRQWWLWQRTQGLCGAVRQEAEEKELCRLAKYSRTNSGLRKLKQILRAARPTEQRQVA